MYVACLLIFFIAIFLSNVILERAYEYASRTYDPFTYATIGYLVTAWFGFLMGLEHLLKQKYISGSWKIDQSKFLIMGLPAFLFSTWPWLPYILMTLFKFDNLRIAPSILENYTLNQFILIFSVWAITTSFHKENIDS